MESYMDHPTKIPTHLFQTRGLEHLFLSSISAMEQQL
jgi:hypothetical protein